MPVPLGRRGQPEQELLLGVPYMTEDMADAILLGKAPQVSLTDSRSNVAAILALYESAKTGKVISL